MDALDLFRQLTRGAKFSKKRNAASLKPMVKKESCLEKIAQKVFDEPAIKEELTKASSLESLNEEIEENDFQFFEGGSNNSKSAKKKKNNSKVNEEEREKQMQEEMVS